MRLYYSATSPYVRKVIVCAKARGIDGQIKPVTVDPWSSPAEFLADNPLSKVPCLVTEDGLSLFDSPVICEYLDSVGDVNPVFPGHGAPRWRALRLQAMGDGILDAAVARRLEQGRPQDTARTGVMERHGSAVARTLDMLEAEGPANHLDIGTITIACALGYLDFRLESEPWRETRPRLAHWMEGMQQRPEIASTTPG